ncbi:uncharacterized protein [Ambystoma mexicanum]|uniref:uncharacterized protein isoform X2 n=1 Tax=Ambystoma mexicanum TaxID=8296 RepID=UPI0037E891BF
MFITPSPWQESYFQSRQATCEATGWEQTDGERSGYIQEPSSESPLQQQPAIPNMAAALLLLLVAVSSGYGQEESSGPSIGSCLNKALNTDIPNISTSLANLICQGQYCVKQNNCSEEELVKAVDDLQNLMDHIDCIPGSVVGAQEELKKVGADIVKIANTTTMVLVNYVSSNQALASMVAFAIVPVCPEALLLLGIGRLIGEKLVRHRRSFGLFIIFDIE